MTEPTSSTPPPAEESQGSLGAVLIGGAILVVAALLIFWPDGDSASRTSADAAARNSAAQASAAGGKASGRGQAGGVAPRDHDPAVGRISPRITPALGAASTRSMAPSRPPTPEPTSFPSAEAEIAYYEKKLEGARADLKSRSTFLERMKRVKENAKTPAEQTRAATRGEIVQKNYDRAKQVVAELETKVDGLRRKREGGAG